MKPSDRESEISDMCGDFGRNFEEILTLPEQAAAKIVVFCSAAREKIDKAAYATLSTRWGREYPSRPLLFSTANRRFL
jgi:hypothetical protein